MESQELELFKKNLHQLHFLLTEKETEESRQQAIDKFVTTTDMAAAVLNSVLKNPAKKINVPDVFDQGFKDGLYNANSHEALMELSSDHALARKGSEKGRIYAELRQRHARMLQMVYDMLRRMGEDTEDEDDA